MRSNVVLSAKNVATVLCILPAWLSVNHDDGHERTTNRLAHWPIDRHWPARLSVGSKKKREEPSYNRKMRQPIDLCRR